MGQYHFIINKTKREFINPQKIVTKGETFGYGLKLLEQMGGGGAPANLLLVLLANSNNRGGGDYRPSNEDNNSMVGRWAGDEIVVQGDYVEESDTSYISEEEFANYTDIAPLLVGVSEDLNKVW